MTRKIKITLMLAADENDLIGVNNRLPWELPADLKYFKEMTLNKTVLMGRKTCESLPFLLPKRRNVVLTRNPSFYREGFETITSVTEISDDVIVIGGSEIYKQLTLFADEILLTRVHDIFEGDTYFDTSFLKDWNIESKIFNVKDDKNKHDYTFFKYVR